MEEIWKEFLTGSLPGIITALITAGIPAIIMLRKLKATQPTDNAVKLSDAAIQLMEDMRAELNTVKKEVKVLGVEKDRMRKDLMLQTRRVTRLSGVVKDLYNGALLLVKQLEDQGLEPVWVPPVSAKILITEVQNGD